MPTLLQKLFRDLRRTHPQRSSRAKILRTLVCINAALRRTGAEVAEFERTYIKQRGSCLIYRWLRGEVAAREETLRKIDHALPENAKITELLDLPLFAFLDAGLTLKKVRQLLKPYETPKGHIFAWRFPNDDALREANHFAMPLVRSDSHQLFQRGDIYGFTTIVGLLREAELKPDPVMHMLHAANMFRALPAVARTPEFRDHFDLLKECVQEAVGAFSVTLYVFDVDWEIVRRQIEAPRHEPLRERCPRDPKTLRFIVPDDPVVYRKPALKEMAAEN
jgi:hypothetical protein